MTELYETEPGEASGDRWWLVVAIASGVSLVAAFCFPPAGVVLFMVTTGLAVRRFRQMPVTVIVLVVAVVLAALATPALFLSRFLSRAAKAPAAGTVPGWCRRGLLPSRRWGGGRESTGCRP